MRLENPVRFAGGLALFLSAALPAPAQGTFQNLGFESATIVHAPGYPADIFLFAEAFPGWTGYLGGQQQSICLYNNQNLDSAGLSIIDRGFINPLGWPGDVIQGNFTALLMGGLAGIMQPSDAVLAQTGLVPAGSESLRFRAFRPFPSDPFNVSLGGVALPLIPLASTTNYTLYGADVHAWASQTAELRFTSIA